MTMAKGSVVRHDDALWVVLSLVAGVAPENGPAPEVAQLECLERDASAAVEVRRLEEVTETIDVAALRRARDERFAAWRLRHKIRLHEKQAAKVKATATALELAIAEAEKRLEAGDLRPLENRSLVKGMTLSLAPAELVRLSKEALGNLRARGEKIAASVADCRECLAAKDPARMLLALVGKPWRDAAATGGAA
jgi:hypothetical protein